MVQAVETPSLTELQEAFSRLDRPEWVRSIEVTEDLDADGEWSVWVWIVVDKSMPSQKEAQPRLTALRNRIRALLAEQAPGLWAYIRIEEDDNDG